MAKQGLRKIWILKDQIGLIWGEPDGRRREEEERKKKKRRREGVEIKPSKPKVWKLTLIMNPMRFGMDLWHCRIIIFPKLGVLLGFHLNPKIMESKMGKTPHGIRWLWNPSFEDGFMV